MRGAGPRLGVELRKGAEQAMFRSIGWWLLAGGVWCCGAGGAAAQVYEVRPRYTPGQEVIWRHRVFLHQVLRNPNTLRGSVIKMSLVTGFRTRVLDGQQPNRHPIEVTYLLFVHGIRGPNRYDFDSRWPEKSRSPEQAALAAELLDKPFQVIVDDTGTVVEVHGLESFQQGNWEGTPPFLKSFYLEFVSPQTLSHLLMLQLLP